MGYKRITLNKKSWVTVKDFLNEKNGLTSKLSSYDFLIYDGEQDGNLKNIEKIYTQFSEVDKAKYQSLVNLVVNSKKDKTLFLTQSGGHTDLDNFPIFNSPEVFLPNFNVKTSITNFGGINQFLEQRDMTGFWSEKLKTILEDELYVRDENLGVDGTQIDVELINQNCKVWIWCRALDKIINVTPFIQDINTQKSDIGSFYMTLVPVVDEKNIFTAGGEDTINYFNLIKEDRTIQTDFFHRIFQQNDIVFIRFERLKLEIKDENKPYFDFEISSTKLPGQVWDMIGLVDSCSNNSGFNMTDYSVNVSGRDLLKLIVEDGAFFLSRAYIQSAIDKFILIFDPGTKGYRRNISGQFDPLQYEFLNGGRRIDDSIGFIVNQLSNLGVLSDESRGLFDSYGNKRRTVYKVTNIDDNEVKEYSVEGIWQIVKMFVDGQLDKRRIVDNSSVSQECSLLEQFMKLCQQPFVEFYGDTYGDEFNFIARQPPFTKESIISFLDKKFVTTTSLLEKNPPYNPSSDSANTADIVVSGSLNSCIVDVEAKDLLSYNLQWDETYYAWYQIEPIDIVLGNYSNVAVGGNIPILFFSKIAETFGNHRKVITDNYLFANLNESADYAIDVDNYRSALLNDLKFIVDTNIYLPFTRKGTIVLTKGDRRIRRGTFIRIVPFKEICYVDAVSNDIRFTAGEISRTTTVQVSRCMIENYIKGDVGYNHDGSLIPDKKFSYFNIVDTTLIVNNLLSVQGDMPEEGNVTYNNTVTSEYNVKIPTKARLAYMNNNPGNLVFVGQPTATKGGLGPVDKDLKTGKTTQYYWAVFETAELGFKALIRQIGLYKGHNMTVQDTVYIYAPPSSNNSALYLRQVCESLKVAPDVPLIKVDSYEFAKRVIWKESGSTVMRRDASVVSTPTEIIKGLTNVSSIPKVSEYVIPGSAVSSAPKSASTTVTNNKKFTSSDFGLNSDQFDFFQKRLQLNILKK